MSDLKSICDAVANLGAVGTLCAVVLWSVIYGPSTMAKAALTILDRLLPPQKPPT